ncbi:MAG: hypothetical protein Q4F26_06110 [Atopococcus tabaci]|uniref:Uncharacterized protein n=1 Tax=Atopococcus tabaci TaxID=269774 RepID=A0AA43ZSP0_9LACT|nr:hypothetical protein [Atopococcus tabaci]
MADIFDINLEKNRKIILYSYLFYIILFFLYTLAVIFLFHFTQDRTGMDDGYGYYLMTFFLSPHHFALFFSIILYIPAWAYRKKWLAGLSIPLDFFAALHLIYASLALWNSPESLTVAMLIFITLPLLIFAFWLFQIAYQKLKAYFFIKKTTS